MNTDVLEIFQRLGLALAIGLLVGIERGWRERTGKEGSRTAGIRTHALIGLLGGVWAATVPVLGPLPLSFAAVGFAGAFTLFAWRESVADQDFSVTGVIAAMLVFALGAYAVLGNMAAAAASGVVTTVILTARSELHNLLRRLTWPELRSAALLLAMTFLLLPILPNRTIDRWDAINPFELWLMTVLIAAVSFIGYAGFRIIGGRAGPLIAAAIGALVSSTATTLTNARLASKRKGNETGLFASAIAVAWMVSILRMGAIAAVVDLNMLRPMAPTIAAAVVVLAAAVLGFLRRRPAAVDSLAGELRNPYELSVVLTFGVVLTIVALATKVLKGQFGQGGLIALAGISGLADVDPITLSASRLADGGLTPTDAAAAIFVAAAANLLTKMTIAVGVGGARFGVPLVGAGILAIVSGAVTFFTFGGAG